MLIKRKKDKLSNFVIYELNEDESELVNAKFGAICKFYVASGEFSDFYLKNHSFLDIINDWQCISPVYYLGFFQTYLEAYYHIKLIEAEGMIDKMEWKVKEALGMEIYDEKKREMIKENTNRLNVMFFPLTEEKPDIADHPEFQR